MVLIWLLWRNASSHETTAATCLPSNGKSARTTTVHRSVVSHRSNRMLVRDYPWHTVRFGTVAAHSQLTVCHVPRTPATSAPGCDQSVSHEEGCPGCSHAGRTLAALQYVHITAMSVRRPPAVRTLSCSTAAHAPAHLDPSVGRFDPIISPIFLLMASLGKIPSVACARAHKLCGRPHR